jgi:hypothetical protein
MAVSRMLRSVAPVRTDVSEELSTPIIRGKRIGELGSTLAITSNRRKLRVFFRSVRRLLVYANVPSSSILVTLMKEAILSSETSVLTGVTRRNIPEDVILHCCFKYLRIIHLPLANSDVGFVYILKTAVLSGVTPYGSCKNQRFGGTYRLHLQGDVNRQARNNVSSK